MIGKDKREQINYCLSYDFVIDVNDQHHIEEIFSRLKDLGFTIKHEDNDKHYYTIDAFTMTVNPIDNYCLYMPIYGIINNNIFVKLLRYIFYIGDITDVLNGVIINCENFTAQEEVSERLKRMLIHFKNVGFTSNLLCFKNEENMKAAFQRKEDYEAAYKINNAIFLQIYEIWKIRN